MRMIVQGDDGLSRGIIMDIVVSGEDVLSFFHLHLSALQWPDNLIESISCWLGRGKELPMSQEDWFKKVQVITGNFTKS